MDNSRRFSTDWLLLAGFCAFLFFFGLAYFGLVGPDEPRYAQVAREMLARHDWITPVLGGKPWLEKPVLYYWQAILIYSVFGVSDWAARLPSAIDATLMVIAIYLFLRRFRPELRLDGALMTASAAGIVGIRPRCFHGHGARRQLHHRSTRLVWMARNGQKKIPRCLLCISGNWNAGQRAGRAGAGSAGRSSFRGGQRGMGITEEDVAGCRAS